MGGPDIVRGKLTTAIDLFTGSFVHQALSGSGPFTLFLMVDSAFANLTQEQVKIHRIGKFTKCIFVWLGSRVKLSCMIKARLNDWKPLVPPPPPPPFLFQPC